MTERIFHWDAWLPVLVIAIINGIFLLSIFVFALFYWKKNKEEDEEVLEYPPSKLLNRFIREWWMWFDTPFEILLIKARVTPNLVTFFSLVASMFAGYFFHRGWFGSGGWFVLISGILDYLDGRIARKMKMDSKAGAFYDSTLDRYSESFAFFGLMSYYRDDWMLYVVMFAYLGSMMVSYTRARGESLGVGARIGIMQRTERVVYLGAGATFSPLVMYLTAPWFDEPRQYLLIAAIIFIAVMANMTALRRLFYIMRKLKDNIQ
ncbi:MAG: CDP-alcohol phosphatidyltransferase family protein [Deltaproteobacteria bacterium]|nr:MAG: CDP-alcohol phosphatidyltransferase family protein [Deltaproteobacteria bacterium]